MANLPKELQFFASIHTSKGVYKQPKLDINAFLESGELPEPTVKPVEPIQKPKPVPKQEKPTIIQEAKAIDNSNTDNDQNAICKSNTPDFLDKLKEALEFLKQGLPDGNIMKVMIPYAINIIKPADGKENVWFDCVSFDGTNLQVILNNAPEKIKYLKQGSVIKPSLDKVEKFAFSK